MKTCTNHNFIVVHQEDSCPVCRMERLLREARRLVPVCMSLCDKIDKLEREIAKLKAEAVGR